MQANENGELAIISIVVVFLVFLPIVIVATRSRTIVSIAAILLCICSVGVFFIGGIAMSGLSIVMMMPISGALWFSGLLCALVAWVDSAQDRRSREMTLRLLLNDTKGLGYPEDYKRGFFR